MKTAVIGYPRIGKKRELKFASEKYFSKEINSSELEKVAFQIRKENWNIQKEARIDFISSNDFSFYDGVLDACFMLSAIPERYKKLSLPKLDAYFAMARGFQNSEIDVKALPMKKWFNTNYHYIVPELDDSTQFKLDSSKITQEFNEAKKLGIETKPCVLGPYTFLKLARYVGKKTYSDFADEIATCYKNLLNDVSEIHAKWIQLDEPALVLDMNEEEIKCFTSIYKNLLSDKKIKIILQTYFGDVRDCYNEIVNLDFDAIGLDFIEGKQTLNLLEKNGFPKEKLLFAGMVNGKNIWKNNYEKTIALVNQIKKLTDAEIIVNTSCSLLHVPCTIENETKLNSEILNYFAFAQEKITEIREIAENQTSAFEKNKNLFSKNRIARNEEIAKKISTLKEEDFIRKPCFEERELAQKKALNLPKFPTTTIGSFPQTKEIRANRAGFKKGTVSLDEYTNFIRTKISECIKKQEELGLDVLVHGEFERNDMVEYFGEHLEGYVFTENGWVQSYGTRCVKPPVIWSDVSRKESITVEWSKYAQSCTKKPMKGMLTGPVTILNWSFPREDISIKESCFQIALAIREEVLDLEKNGIKIIQIDEAALKEKLPLRHADWHSEYLDFAIKAFNLVHSGCKTETQIHTHMCYSEFIPIISDIDNMDADVITFEASRSNLEILNALKEKKFRTEVGPGVYDIHSPRIPSVEEIVNAVNKMKMFVNPSKLWINPDCGLKTRGEKETFESLKNLVESAKIVRGQI